MKEIVRKPIEGARVLTPLEMNKINFSTGKHTEVAGKGIDVVKAPPKTTGLKASSKTTVLKK